MCRHFPDAQVTVRTACCRKFYDCPQCHVEAETHPLKRTLEVTLVCKKCRKAFRKNIADWDTDTDSFCPHCDNEFVLASTAAPPTDTEEPTTKLEKVDARMIRDGEITGEDLGLGPDWSSKMG